MITEQQVIAQMRQVMTQIESSTGEAQKRHLAKLMGFCELLLAETSEAKSVGASQSPTVTSETKPPLDRQMAAFLGIPMEEDEQPKSDSLLDF
ncbi:DUF5327 family protein [Exiguobacterium profundum]|uniref:YwdI family protein n=1 Tax=Exiguobacterium profundum TaxID=307643 RepID=A0ABY8B2Y4_9BACL|nr:MULTISPECIES: DUF5327 family protein [Exiguobacterium]QPI67983.1 DUF5327 family protein [Exiguobacterium sp. PBE]MBG0918191.1 hypothetical protein [Exiguobacterium sp. SRB7LM]MBQ6459885.1 DUF5327 family protein [Exiguobacterium sp.]MBR3216520.1 DUF5327 family protein [Exiguobacterium sp.]MBR3321449.1 DUF5327 family protein [Exiguobacterium sp.]